MNSLLNFDKVYFASCSLGVEELLSKELEILGTKKNQIKTGGVEFKCDELCAIKIVLRSRLASKVYKKLFLINIKSEKDIYDLSINYNWESIFALNQTFNIDTIITKNVYKFKNGNYLTLILKDAIVDFFRKKYEKRPSIEKNISDISFLQVIEHDKYLSSSVYLDLCIEPLNKRTYRTKPSLAPLKENLAAAILNYCKIENFDYFVDLLSGSGTFPIEAVLAKHNLPAQYLNILKYRDDLNKYHFFQSCIFNSNINLEKEIVKLIKTLIIEINKKLLEIELADYFASANDINTANNLEVNVLNSKFKNSIKISSYDALSYSNHNKNSKGLLISNLPYGNRIKTDLNFLNDFSKHIQSEFKLFDIYILTNVETLSYPNRKIFYNGPIKVYLYKIN